MRAYYANSMCVTYGFNFGRRSVTSRFYYYWHCCWHSVCCKWSIHSIQIRFRSQICVYFIFHFSTVAVVLFDDKCLSQNQHVNYHHIVVVEPRTYAWQENIHEHTAWDVVASTKDRRRRNKWRKIRNKKQIGEFVIVQVGNWYSFRLLDSSDKK